MGLESSKSEPSSANTEQPKKEEAKTSGLESAQRKRFLRSESDQGPERDFKQSKAV
ncbi:hypothetical protein SynNOUM97013_01850 [Synechococcus sp. NOUM97013]|nr:hypothetical protein SynNOUM97013_01850 [Synechococcus sp. NOUM97013]